MFLFMCMIVTLFAGLVLAKQRRNARRERTLRKWSVIEASPPSAFALDPVFFMDDEVDDNEVTLPVVKSWNDPL